MFSLRSGAILGAVLCAFSVSGCSTNLVNANTLDLASTVDQLAIRQVVYNLTKFEADPYSLPAHVQISGGSVNGRTSVTPQITAPLTTALQTTQTLASAVVAATGATTTTSTRASQVTRNASTTTLSATAENSDLWTIVPVQDPDQVRRLRLLYQYATGYLSVGQFTCKYTIPEKASDKTATNTFYIAANAKAVEQALKNGDSKIKSVYLRRHCRNYYRNYTRDKETHLWKPNGQSEDLTQLSENPDAAFLVQPSCILCAIPFHRPVDIKKYSRGAYTSEVEDVPVNAAIIAKKKLAFYEVVLSEGLAPLGDQANCNPSKNILGFRPEKHETKCVDWLVVVKDGNPPSNAKFIGAANGYSVYINDEHRAAHRFSELVLAITEAMLQPSQLGKVGPVAPTIVVAN